MGALYKGLIVTGLLSIVGLGGATSLTIGWGEIGTVAGMAITGTNLFICGLVGLLVTALIVVITEYYTGTDKRPVDLDRPGLGHRPRHQRHPGPRGLAGIDGAAGPRHRRRHHRDLPAGRPVRHGDRRHHHARPRRHDRRARRLRPGHRQCRRHRRNGRPAQGSPPFDRRARRGRQHHQGGHQGLCDRLGRSRRAGAVRGLQLRPAVFRGEPDAVPVFRRSSARSRSTCPTPTWWPG